MSSYSGPSYRIPGSFEYDKVTFAVRGGRFVDLVWTPTKCPPEVVALFASYIGPNPQQVIGLGEPFEG